MVRLAGLILLLGAGLSAQQPTGKERVPELRKSLHRLAKQKTIKVVPYATSMALLDALIRLEATLPPNEIEPWLTDSTLPAAMVLMARQPKKCERLLLDLFESSGKDPWHSEPWEVAGNLLVSIKSRKFASRIVAGLHASLSVNLHDAGSTVEQNYTIGLGDGAGASPDRRPRMTASDLYRLEKWFASPPFVVYTPEDISGCKLEWICALLDIKIETQPFQLRNRATIAWKDSDTYVRRITREKTRVQGSFRSLVNRLRLKGLVTKEEAAGINPSVSVHVFDHRQDHTTPLPEIEGVKVTEALGRPNAKGQHGS